MNRNTNYIFKNLNYKIKILYKKYRDYGLLIVPISAFGLGVWQIRRRQWKLDIIENLKIQLNKTPIDIKIYDSVPYDLPPYTLLKLTGVFDYDKEVFVGPRSLLLDSLPNKVISTFKNNYEKLGYNVITPMRLIDSSETVLVNRGWVPLNHIDRKNSTDPMLTIVQEIDGFVRKTEHPSILSGRENVKMMGDKNHPRIVMQCKNIETLSKLMGSTQFLVDMRFDQSIMDQGGPIGGQTRINIRNEHMQYILTWFGLGVASMIMWIKKFP